MAIDEEALHHLEPTRSPISSEARNISSEQLRDFPVVPPASTNYRSTVKMADTNSKKKPPRLLHPFLDKIPMHVRFGLNGFLSNVGFMVAYNLSVVQFDGMAPPSTIYSIVYLIFIPIGHAMISLLVFGWPERYFPSLMSNAPIGLTAIAIGAMLTAYLDQIGFNKQVVDLLAQGWSALGYETMPKPEDEKGEFYSSLLVLLITGVWTFILSVFINSPSETSEKKEN